ncbi:MAG: PrsW family intramembrane metalloprotease [Alphaproteobacteria bacterium]|nr:PrsW family intramembrane metalloprotease [Alphaproteobacteria bacterium]
MSPLFPMLLMASVVCAVLPMALFLALVWWLDRYDREPVWLILLTFFWGALGATLLSLLGNTFAHLGIAAIVGPEQASTLTPVIVAPLVEEPTKAAVLFLVLLSRHFDNTTDGFVYGAAVGLGFGMTENLLYFWQMASLTNWDPAEGLRAWAGTVAVRTFYSAVLHASASSLVGAALGWSRFRSWPAKIFAVPVGFAFAMGIHALWNGLLTWDEVGGHDGDLARINMVVFPFEVAAIFLIFQAVLWAERSSIRDELRAEAERGTLPAAHVPHLVSWTQRSWGSWLPAGVHRDAYVRAATTLAHRLRQARAAHDDPFYTEEVERLRREVRGLLAHQPR